MRIISGWAKGRKLFTPPARDNTIRPTSDRAREALFNIIGEQVRGATVLDLFAGTGNISYEFASRGATTLLSIDNNPLCVQFIKETAEKLKFENMKVIRADVFSFLSSCKLKFDVIFADPPYDLERLAEIPDYVFKADILNPGGMLIVEHGKRNKFAAHNNYFESRNYGKVYFSFFRNLSEPES